jgi:uncharacterized protein
MSRATLRRTVQEIHAYAYAHPELGGVQYLWHGGEPMVAGINFFREAVEIQKSLQWSVPYRNDMQSNGLLLDEDWVSFLREELFHISFSLDGTRELNDLTRVDHHGSGSFDRIMRAYRLAKDGGLTTGVVLTLTSLNAPHAANIYRNFAAESIPFSVLPLLNAGNARGNFDELSLMPEAYLRAWTTMYDLWLDGKPYVYVSNFVHETRAVLTGRPNMCTGLANCADSTIAIEPDGSVYPCGSLAANPELSYGTLASSSLENLMSSSVARNLRHRQHTDECLKCKWFHTCHGGCMSRAHKYKGTVHVKDYYCHALYGIYEHIEMRVKERELNRSAPSPSHFDKNLALHPLLNEGAELGGPRTIIPIVAEHRS